MKHKYVFLSLFLLFLIIHPWSTVSAIASIGHFDDTSWSGLDSGYNDVSVDITINTWNGGSDAYYYSNNAYLTNGTNIYGGLQTNGYDGTKWVGKMAIFSIWDTSSGIAEPGGTAVSFGGEGTGYSVRLPFSWTTNTNYRFKMYIDQDSSSGNRLWGASVTNLSTNQTTRIGRIYAPVSYGKIRSPISFHERYIGNTSACNEMSPSQVTFSNMTANGGTTRATSWSHYLMKSLAECPSAVWVQDNATGYVSGIQTAKPAAPAPVQSTPKPKVAQAPVATAPEAVPEIPSELATDNTLSHEPVPSKNKQNNYLLKIIFPLSGFLLLTSGSYIFYKYFLLRKHRKYIQKHFPYDFDIHGPRL